MSLPVMFTRYEERLSSAIVADPGQLTSSPSTTSPDKRYSSFAFGVDMHKSPGRHDTIPAARNSITVSFSWPQPISIGKTITYTTYCFHLPLLYAVICYCLIKAMYLLCYAAPYLLGPICM